MNRKPIVVNFFAGPGAGKSTGATYVFSQLKMFGINCEYISEFAKDKTWERNNTALSCQEFVFGNQSYKMWQCCDQVDVIVTDSPLLLSTFYNFNPVLGEDFNKVCYNVFNSYINYNFFIERYKKYNPIGRNQTLEEAKEIDSKIKKALEEHNVSFQSVKGTKEGYDFIVYQVLQGLGIDKTNAALKR